MACNLQSNKTATLRKDVSKYKNMRKWIIEFLRKVENRSIKSARVSSIFVTKYVNLQVFTLIFYCLGARCDKAFYSPGLGVDKVESDLIHFLLH